jgi:hypothetical protein
VEIQGTVWTDLHHVRIVRRIICAQAVLYHESIIRLQAELHREVIPVRRNGEVVPINRAVATSKEFILVAEERGTVFAHKSDLSIAICCGRESNCIGFIARGHESLIIIAFRYRAAIFTGQVEIGAVELYQELTSRRGAGADRRACCSRSCRPDIYRRKFRTARSRARGRFCDCERGCDCDCLSGCCGNIYARGQRVLYSSQTDCKCSPVEELLLVVVSVAVPVVVSVAVAVVVSVAVPVDKPVVVSVAVAVVVSVRVPVE